MKLGLQVGMYFQRPWQGAAPGSLPDMSVSQEVFARFSLQNSADQACVIVSLGTEMNSHLDRGSSVGWKNKDDRPYVQELTQSGNKRCFTNKSGNKLKIRNEKKLESKGELTPGDTSAVTKALVPHAGPGNGVNPDFGEIPLPGDNLGDNGWNDDRIDQGPISGSNLIIQSKRSIDGPGVAPFDESDVGTVSILEERTSPTDISTGTKKLRLCNIQVNSDTYPAYPDYYQDPNTQKNFDSSPLAVGVKKYSHNSTAQTISRFFANWMENSAATTRDCNWIRRWMVNQINPGGGAYSVAKLLAKELGSRYNLDRLTVFLTNANRIKGKFFQFTTAVSFQDFNNLQAGDEQLAFMKELGMVFTYINNADVAQSFCTSYNGMLNVLDQFDQWYTAYGPDRTTSNLRNEFSRHVRTDLDQVVLDGRRYANMLYNTYKRVGLVWRLWWAAKWYSMFQRGSPFYQYGQIKIDFGCANLPPTRV
ncbi:hypothetical protein AOQ84DRAFT_372514 [Glonium stellatum]|uniref:Uncharacterized protein n=1 Tax=Glonium stellatum TaxID=574774 RepID=A0A8E2F9H5_9PEZI|nr:hypothetical protein AOQ84DRAFT_372514 [Glonium stellatum]